MAVVLHHAPRTDLLARALGDLLAAPLADPFATEVVVVPARGVERTEWYAGRPVLVTANGYSLGLFNGDTGVVVAEGEALRAHISGGASFAVSRLGDVETLHAMTVHKGQGSQAEAVTVLLPDEASPLLTRELFYIAVTRARRRVRVVGTPEAVRAAVLRRARRASGLAVRLRS
ncbi:ATP-binding domain-containing protein [Isoptericola croceus]|uniref:ATP-binding domain-containing protein n=1 Tax=Isoptericola croceus TaxID=3031406 RepID=UPI0023FA43F2|nr:ATP-binding domain-containing protein [Isoptericola croceus]